MIRSYHFWLKSAITFQFLTGSIHLLSFLNKPEPKNESEKQLLDLMSNYQFDLGGGFLRSMEDLMNSFGITYTLFLFFSGMINTFLLKSNIPLKIMKGVVLINFFTYLIFFITMCMLTFLPPIICSGLILFLLLLAFLKINSATAKHQL